MNKIFTLFACLAIAVSAHAQHVCGVTHEDQLGMIQRIEEFNKRSQDLASTRTGDPIYIPVKFHLVADNDGEGRVKIIDVLEQMTTLIDDYAKMNMHLYIADNDFNYIDNTSIFYNAGSFGSVVVANKVSHAINIFIPENANTGSGQGTVLGFYSPNGDYIIMGKPSVISADSGLSHEIGHLFDLPHTFFGWEGYEPANPDGIFGWNQNNINALGGQISSVNVLGTGIPIELVNGSNCTTAADRICDTPPDYNFGFGWNGCDFNLEMKDRNGDINDPMETNMMGYFLDCISEFTQGQEDVMRDNFNSPSRAGIRSTYIPDMTEIISSHELLEPEQNAKLDYYDQIFLDWSDAEGAKNYVVSITEQGAGVKEYITTESEIRLDELAPNKFHFWEVKPFNEGFTDAETISSFFTTGTEQTPTSVKESQIIQNVNVYPNPASIGSDINISLSIEKSATVNISMVDITGNMVMNQMRSLTEGNNNISLSANGLTSGIYILKMDTEDGAIHKKVIIQ